MKWTLWYPITRFERLALIVGFSSRCVQCFVVDWWQGQLAPWINQLFVRKKSGLFSAEWTNSFHELTFFPGSANFPKSKPVYSGNDLVYSKSKQPVLGISRMTFWMFFGINIFSQLDSLERQGQCAERDLRVIYLVGSSSQADHLMRNTAMDDSIGGS